MILGKVQHPSSIKFWGMFKFISVLILFIGFSLVYGQYNSSNDLENDIFKNSLQHDSAQVCNTYIISGKVTQTTSYCGGAAPPQELLDRLATPIAYPDKKLYIRKGRTNNIKSNILKTIITDSAGEFSIRLAAGTYVIIQEEQLQEIKAADYKKEYLQVDEKCLQEWWTKPYYLLEVKKENITNLHFNIQHDCFMETDVPCITYTGPQRP